jgi:multicomponent Na+:H+ antiporter subunit C
MHGYLPYVLGVALFAVGLYAVAVKKNLIKIIIGVIVMHHATNLFLVLVGYRVPEAGEPMAPVAPSAARQAGIRFATRSVDPLPQAMVLTSIVIGVSLVALMVVMALRLHEKYGTFDLEDIRELRG